MLSIIVFSVVWSLLGNNAVSGTSQTKRGDNGTSTFAASLLQESMDWMDMFYDSEVGYLYSLDSTALTHETRASVWYSAGLLARNEGDDAEQAGKIIRNVIGAQFKIESDQWFGDYQKYPEEPTVGTKRYPPKIYNSWDPNWRGFIGTTFILMLEEFPDLIEYDLQQYMLESLYNTTIGDSYRVGGVDDDNLYPSYSNPAIMRAFVSGWTGRRLNKTNETDAGETYAQEVIDLFRRDNTLSEFNSGTYAGVSLFALTLWAKYFTPEESVMGEWGPKMIRETWNSLGQLYNANLRNVAGPWDRSYGFDMNKYLSILALQIWTIVGKENAPINAKPYAMGHKNDFAIGPLISILAPFHNNLVSSETISSLQAFQDTHTVNTSAFSPPYDTYPRNISAWLSPNLTIGAESFSENLIGGPSKNSKSFNPAVVQWGRADGSVGWLTLYANVMELDVEVGEGTLSLTYPNGNSSSSFQFLVATNPWGGKRDVTTWEDIEGVKIDVTGNVELDYEVTFNGANGGSGDPINEFEFWKFTYTVPPSSTSKPTILLSFSLSQKV